MNLVAITGRLTKDPEVRQVGETVACKFTVAVDRDRKDKDGNRETDFIPVDLIGQPAEFASKYLTKGRLVAVQGSFRVDNYTDAQGTARTFTKVAGKSVQALDSAKDHEGAGDANVSAASKPSINKPGKPAKPARPGKPAKANA